MCIIKDKRLIIVTNASFQSQSATRQSERLLHEASKYCQAQIAQNDATYLPITSHKSSNVVIFLDKDIYKAKQLEMLGAKVCNSATAIELSDDKATTQLAIATLAEVKMPVTIIAPKIYFGSLNVEFLHTVSDKLGLPLVIKECSGSLGKQVYLAKDFEELQSIVKEIGTRPHLYQQYIKQSTGRSLRVYVVGGKVVASGRLANTNDFRSNAENGGTMVPCNISKKMEQAVLAIANRLGLTFGGIDMFDTEEPIFIEANSNAYFAELERCSGVNIAQAIVENVLEIGDICQK